MVDHVVGSGSSRAWKLISYLGMNETSLKVHFLWNRTPLMEASSLSGLDNLVESLSLYFANHLWQFNKREEVLLRYLKL